MRPRSHIASAFRNPSGFSWSPFPIAIPSSRRFLGAGTYAGIVSPSSLIPTPATTLYVSTSGSDANPGTSWGQAKRSLFGTYAAISGVTRVYIEAGTYYNDNGWKSVTLTTETTNYQVIGVGGRVRMLSQEAALTWSSAGSGAYNATLAAAPFGVLDENQPDAYGIPTWLTQQASVGAVQSNGGWFHTGTTLTVKTFDARSPDTFVVAAQTGTSGFNLNNAAVSGYHEGIDWIGFTRGFHGFVANRCVAVGCKFLNSQTAATEMGTITDSYMFDCVAGGAYNADGFTYGASGNCYEQNCRGVSNGWSASDTSNGSTSHGATVMRVGGFYWNNKGPNVADVRASAAGSLSLNFACSAGASRAAGVSKTNFCTDANRAAAETSSMWLVDCIADNLQSTDLYGITAGSQFFLRNTGYVGLAGSGTVATF